MRCFRIWMLLAVLCPALPGVVSSQESVSIGQVSSPLLARLERGQRHENVCVLVNRAGQYRVERVFAAKTDIFAGELSPSDLGAFQRMLDSNELLNLSQQQVPTVLITDVQDTFTIAVFRTKGLQSIVFPSSESRQPFRRALDPLVKWLSEVQKGPHTKLAQDAANRCLPANAKQPIAQPSSRSLPGSTGLNARGLDYLVRMTTDRFFRSAARTCIIVGPSGRYHMERATQAINNPEELRVFEASLDPGELQDLGNVLNDAELINQASQDSASIPPSQNAEITTFMIPRSGGIQSLLLTSYFNVHALMTEPGGSGNMRYGVEKDAKAVEPLRNWIKDHIEKKKLVPLEDVQANGCSLSP